MTPKEQCDELILKFKFCDDGAETFSATRCALVCVQFILNANPQSNPFNADYTSPAIIFWMDVRREIINYQIQNHE